MNVGIIGYGLQGKRRESALSKFDNVVISDPLVNDTPWQEITDSDEIDIVIVSTPNNMLAEIANRAAIRGKKVMVEKPAARNLKEIAPMRGDVKVGYTLRHHPAIQEAKKLLAQIGEIMYIRAHYGHGGRPGYEKEWRMNPEISGGGQFIDQGSHLVDLCFFFTQHPVFHVTKELKNYYYKSHAEDNAFVNLYCDDFVAQLHTSCTEWKNSFRFEIFGREGKIDLKGLGHSYGTETITCYKNNGDVFHSQAFPVFDPWKLEWQAFLRGEGATLEDAEKVLRVVERVYK